MIYNYTLIIKLQQLHHHVTIYGQLLIKILIVYIARYFHNDSGQCVYLQWMAGSYGALNKSSSTQAHNYAYNIQFHYINLPAIELQLSTLIMTNSNHNWYIYIIQLATQLYGQISLVATVSIAYNIIMVLFLYKPASLAISPLALTRSHP